ncbi:alpha/beta fold hydrolase [Microbacterium foliorum]|uniref:alpha/beta fold hydrolase n=1 Tax=Microbacterium foliorum TaxID=104336 RepID=UPI0009A00184|nr:alpha/beta hydrolase [Microbacterium foliorum]AQY01841.1 alpha/beta hydrolase [Microbacterium foliorum]
MINSPAAPYSKVITRGHLELATYSFGDPHAPTVLAVHGFASSALLNWHVPYWTSDLVAAGFHVLAVDQIGHGNSAKPINPTDYSLRSLVDDLREVLDAYLIDQVDYLGYSLGARVGWQACINMPDRITRAVLGGLPDGLPLTRFRVPAARRYIADHEPVNDSLTRAYLAMAERIPGNRLDALVALVQGAQIGPATDPDTPPDQPLLLATGSEDNIVDASRSLADAAPQGFFMEIPGKNHFNAPASQAFRQAAITFFKTPLEQLNRRALTLSD